MTNQICICVFGDTTEFVPTAASFLRLWKLLGRLGPRKAKSVVYEVGKPLSLKTKELAVQLGDGVPWIEEIPMDAKVAGGIDIYKNGRTSADTYANTDLSLVVKPPGRWQGLPTPASLSLVISERVFDSISPSLYEAVQRAIFEFSIEHKGFYGLIDVDDSSRLLAGDGFLSATLSGLPIERTIQHAKWMRHSYPQKKPLSVFWGNFFAEDILEKLGGWRVLKEFVDSTFYDIRDSEINLYSEVCGGAFVRLSHSPFDWHRNLSDRFFINENAQKLHAFLIENDLL